MLIGAVRIDVIVTAAFKRSVEIAKVFYSAKNYNTIISVFGKNNASATIPAIIRIKDEYARLFHNRGKAKGEERESDVIFFAEAVLI